MCEKGPEKTPAQHTVGIMDSSMDLGRRDLAMPVDTRHEAQTQSSISPFLIGTDVPESLTLCSHGREHFFNPDTLDLSSLFSFGEEKGELPTIKNKLLGIKPKK